MECQLIAFNIRVLEASGVYAMTPERAKELLPVIQAYAEGKTIQYRTNPNILFMDLNGNPSFDGSGEYRIKPQAIKYRLCLWRSTTGKIHVIAANREEDVSLYPAQSPFIRWIHDDWQEVEV